MTIIKPRKMVVHVNNGRDYSQISRKDITLQTILSLVEQEDSILNYDVINEYLEDFNVKAKIKISKLNSLSDFNNLTNKIELLDYFFESGIPYMKINEIKHPEIENYI